MPVAYYIIPMTTPPYSRENPQRPEHVGSIRCEWTGYPVDGLGVYVCKINTTSAKHSALAASAGLRQLPLNADWDTVISATGQRNPVETWCGENNIPYDATETVGDFLLRVINTGLFSLGNKAVDAKYSELTKEQAEKIDALCDKYGQEKPKEDETISEISKRMGRVYWDASKMDIEEF